MSPERARIRRWLQREGAVRLQLVAELMGHAKVDTTLNVYTPVIDGSKRPAAREIGDGLITIDHKRETGISATS